MLIAVFFNSLSSKYTSNHINIHSGNHLSSIREANIHSFPSSPALGHTAIRRIENEFRLTALQIQPMGCKVTFCLGIQLQNGTSIALYITAIF